MSLSLKIVVTALAFHNAELEQSLKIVHLEMTSLYHSWSFRMVISVVSLIEQDTALNPIVILKYWLKQWFSTLYVRITWGNLKNMNVGVLLSESLIYLIQNGAWALVFLDPSQVRMCRQCWKILKLKKLGETVIRPVLLLASPVILVPHFVEFRVVNEKYLLVWKHWFVNLFPAYIYFFLRTWKFWWEIIPQMPFCPLCRKISHLCFF